MDKNIDFRLFAYFVIMLGVMLSFTASVVPHYATGHDLQMTVLLTGLFPYLVYGLFTDVVRGWPLLIAGALLLGIDVGIKIPERFLRYDEYASGLIYYAPLVSTLLIIVILGMGTRREKRWRGLAIENTTGKEDKPTESAKKPT